MLIPQLHFGGRCKEAIALYEKAFRTKVKEASIDYARDGYSIANAAMNIHGTEVYMNDAFGNLEMKPGCGAVHLIVIFPTPEEMMACYEVLKTEEEKEPPFHQAPYSPLLGNFMDRFGVMWGFMAAD